MYTIIFFSISVFNLLISYFVTFFIYRSFYSFQFSSLIAISHMFGFSFWFLSFKISNFVLGTFVEVFLISISSFNQIFCGFIFFNLTLIL